MNYKSYLIEQDIRILKDKINLFYGENIGLKNDFKKSIKKNNSNFIIINFNQEEIIANQNLFYNEFYNNSLFEENKIFFIEQANDKILNLIQNIETKIKDQKVFIFSDTLEKKSKLRDYFEKAKELGVVACYNDNEITLKKIILGKLKNYKGMSTNNINLILNSANGDRYKLNNELDKIITFFNDKEIKTTELLKLLNITETDSFEPLKDAALDGNVNVTNKLLSDTLILEEKIILYLNNFNQRLIKLRDITSIKDKPLPEIIENMRPPVFWKDKPIVTSQARKWNSKKIQNLLKETFDFEKKLKTNSILNKKLLFKKLIIDICLFANA